ncbi:hypothetical protein BO1005MUT1_250005 [Hyphomicrobiales bacterium]|nr:hypothetical protein BO1005MUT1_250005 [Hyphomicrobiales bacterium]
MTIAAGHVLRNPSGDFASLKSRSRRGRRRTLCCSTRDQRASADAPVLNPSSNAGSRRRAFPSPPNHRDRHPLTNGRFRDAGDGGVIVRDYAGDGVAKFDCKTSFS